MVLFPCSFPSRASTTAVEALYGTAAAWPQCLCLPCSLLPLHGRAQNELISLRCLSNAVYLLKSDHATEPMPNAVTFTYGWLLQSQQDHSERLKLSIRVGIFSICLPLLKTAMLICVLKHCEREAPPTPRATHKNILNSKGSRTCQSCYPCTTQTSVKISCFCEQILQRAEFGSKSFREYFYFPFLCLFCCMVLIVLGIKKKGGGHELNKTYK